MSSAHRKETTFLDEHGVVITTLRLAVLDKTLRWSELGYVNIMRNGGNPVARLLKRPKNFRLMISTKANVIPVCLLETSDEAFMRRIEFAINQVAKTLKAGP